MQLACPGVSGPPADPAAARAVLRLPSSSASRIELDPPDQGWLTSVGQAVIVGGTGTPDSQGRILPNCTSSP